ncbi:MAG: P-type conjugative transfer protein TrbL [Pseudomonadota bacterium]
MTDMGVIDRFLDVFTRYIDSGFGLLGGEVAWLASTLVVIDVTIAALFWAWGADEDVLARLVKKTLFVGAFAFILGNWNNLARIVFESFAGLGLKASGTSLTMADFLRPGRIAQTGLEAGQPILDSISGLMGFVSFFENFIQIAILLLAWAVVLLSFFILAIQLFIALIEFKLATLCGFVLVPFGLWGKTAFMAERVLGLVVSSGVKVLVLAVIVGIGSTLFQEFTQGFQAEPTIEDAAALMLAALSLLGLGMFAPGIANGIVSGGPQMGAGAAVGTALLAGGAAVGAGAAAKLGASALAGGAAKAAGGAASVAGGATSAYKLGSEAAGGSVRGGLEGVARAGAQAIGASAKRAGQGIKDRFAAGGEAVRTQGGAAFGSGAANSAVEPGWARAMRDRRTAARGAETAAHTLKSSDRGGAGASIDLKENE